MAVLLFVRKTTSSISSSSSNEAVDGDKLMNERMREKVYNTG